MELTNKQIEQLIKHFEGEVFDLSDPALVLGTGEAWANNQKLALVAVNDLKVALAQVAMLEKMNLALEENLSEEHTLHGATFDALEDALTEIARLNELLGQDLRSAPYVEWKTG